MNTVRPVIDSYATDRLRSQALDVLTGGTGRAKPETLKSLEKAVAVALECSEPVGIYGRSNVIGCDAGTVTTHDAEIMSRMFSRLAAAATGERLMVVFSIATVGGTFDEELAAQGSLLDQFVLDAVGSELAEIVADLVEEEWKNDLAATGLDASLRMSPGYCDWAIQGQDAIFTALDGSSIGVRLTPSYLMVPAKSVSGAAIASESMPLKVPCVICSSRECPFRRADHDASQGRAPTGAGEEGLSA